MDETLKVLVVDDEAGMRAGVERALRNYTAELRDPEAAVAFSVRQAESGEAGLAAVREDRPDILLLDYKLPGMSGLDVLEAIDGDTAADMLTVMITAYASIETAVSATKHGAYEFLPKPFTPAELKSTVRKCAQHILLRRRARDLEEEKRRVRFEFIRVLGHELKAPLNAVEGYLHLVQDRGAGDALEAYDNIMNRCVTRIGHMKKLIVDLLDMTRIESGEKRRELALVDVMEVARESVENLLPDAEPRGIEIALRGPDALTMTADRGEIGIIFNNLVSNAVKYNRDGGRVDVDVSREGDTITIAVADTGIGMTAEECEKLFGDFVRIRNAKTTNILGSGLGLSILKKLAHLYDGDTSVRSVPDEGSTFTVALRDAGN